MMTDSDESTHEISVLKQKEQKRLRRMREGRHREELIKEKRRKPVDRRKDAQLRNRRHQEMEQDRRQVNRRVLKMDEEKEEKERQEWDRKRGTLRDQVIMKNRIKGTMNTLVEIVEEVKF